MSGLVRTFPGFQLGPVDLEVCAGAACGLLGPNGAGKSTLLNCVAGQLTPDAGQVMWHGRAMSRANWRLREAIAFVPERPRLYGGLTVAQTLRFCATIFETWDEEFASRWMLKFGLPAKQRVRTLSKGLNVKLHLLIGLAHSARLLLLDEPTAGLDPESRIELHEHIRTLITERRACALISSHLFRDIEAMATEFRIIRRGQFVLGSTLDSIQKMRVYRLPDNAVPRSLLRSSALLKAWSRDGERILLLREGMPDAIEAATSSPAENLDLEKLYFLTGFEKT